MKKLKILISGASSGIGKASAEELAKAGHEVWAGLRNLETKFSEPSIKPVRLDVTSPQSISDCLKLFEEIDVLINNAGIAVGGPLESIGHENFKKQFDVNVFGLYELSRCCIPLLKKSSHAKIINIGSVSGLFSTPFMGPYCASKYAVEALSDAFRRELKKFGIQVVLIEPGPIATPIWEKSINASPQVQFPETVIHYEPELTRFRKLIEEESKKAIPVEKVSELILKVTQSKSPKARYMINGNKLMLRTLPFFPEHWVDKALSSGSKLRR